MNRLTSRKRWRLLFVAMAVMTINLTASAYEDEDGEGEGRDESWQIEQRQQWFVESRGLLEHPEASRLRASAVENLKAQRKWNDLARAASGEVWQELGPSSMNMVDWVMGRVAGRLNAITPMPGNDETVYVGAAGGGVWKTTNAGISWAPIFDNVGTLPIGAIAIDAAMPNTVWVGTGDKNSSCGGYFGQGVFLSEDAGATWSARNGSGTTSMPLSIVNAVAIQPTDSSVILVGGAGTCNSSGGLSGAGVWRSLDKGLSWSKVLANNVEDIVFVPGTSTVYAGLIGVGVKKSADGGATWADASSGISAGGTSRMRLAAAPSNSNILYVLTGANAGSKLYRTDNGGTTWVQKNASACEGQCTYNQTISVNPTDPDTLLVGTIRVARSTNAGVTITPLVSTWGSSQKVHQDTHVVRYSLNDPNRFWVGSDGGIWRSDDSAATFRNMNANINITQFYDIAVNPNDANIVFGGAQDNSSSGRRTNLMWNLTYASGDGFMNAFDQNNPNIVFQTSYPSGNLPSIVRSTVGGSSGSFNGVANTGITPATFEWVTPLATAGSQLFVASSILYRAATTAGGWTAISTNLGSTAVVITPQTMGTLTPTYVGTSGGKIWSSPDAGIPAPVFLDVTGNYPGGRVSDVAMDPVSPQRVFITRSGFGASRLYRSVVGGGTWSAVGAGLPNVPANSVAIDPLASNRIFVATDVGIYESIDNGDNFTAFSAGLPLGIVVSDMEIDDFPHVLTAGTYSRGAWRVLLAGSVGNSPPTADFSVASDGLAATFSDASIDIDGSIVSYVWSFGDGSPNSTAASPLHTYPAPGNYTVSVTVTDNGGLSASFGKILRFSAPPIALVNGVARNNQTAAQGDDVYYTLEVPLGATNLHFETSSPVGGADADLTIVFNGEVICQSAGGTSAEHCDFPSPETGTYTAIVNAYTNLSNYSILGSFMRSDVIFADGFE